MADETRWFFTEEQLENSPSRRCGYDASKELLCRQEAANLIQDLGKHLHVNQLCINTAIVYMHRFYVFHSFTRFHWNSMAAATLFLATKVAAQAKKLEHIINVSHSRLTKTHELLDVRSKEYLQQVADLVTNESILLQTLGFDVDIHHPHAHIVRCCKLIGANKDFTQTSYFMATNSLHLTTMCLRYKPTAIACFCIHLASKWTSWEIPQSNEGKPWYFYVDETVTFPILEQLTAEFLSIFDKCPQRLKKCIFQQNRQNSLSSQNFSLDMDASSKTLSSTFSGVSFRPPNGLAEQLQSESLNSSGGADKSPEQEYASSARLRQSYNQPVSTSLHKKLAHSTLKEVLTSHLNAVKYSEQQSHQQQESVSQQEADVKSHQMMSQQKLSPQLCDPPSCVNAIAPVQMKQPPEIWETNLVLSQEIDQHGGVKQMKSANKSLSVCGHLKNGTRPLAPEHELKEFVKQETVSDSRLNASANISVKKDPNSSNHYQKHSCNSSFSISQSSGFVSEEVSSSSFSEFSLSQNSVQSQQETVNGKLEKLSSVQTLTPMSTQATRSIFSPELFPSGENESLPEHVVKTELSSEDSTKKLLTPLSSSVRTTPSMPTNSHERTPELVPAALKSMSGFKTVIDKSKISVQLSNSNSITDSVTTKCVPTDSFTSINLSALVESKLEDVGVDNKLSTETMIAQKQQYVKTKCSINDSSRCPHEKKTKNENKDRSENCKLKSEREKHRKKCEDQKKGKDCEKDKPERRIINNLVSLKISIPREKLQGMLLTGSLKLELSTLPYKEREENDAKSGEDCEIDGKRTIAVDQNPSSLKIKNSKQVLQRNSASSRKRDRSYDNYNSSLSSAPPPKKYFQE